MKRIILLFILVLCFLTGCSDSKKDNDFTKEFMPAFENSEMELRTEFDTDLSGTEESMINMQLWQGKNDTYIVSLF